MPSEVRVAKESYSLQDLSEQLSALKGKVDEAVQQRSRLQGRIDAVTETLRDKFGVKTVEDAEKLLVDMENDLTKLRQVLSDKLEELRGYLRSVGPQSR